MRKRKQTLHEALKHGDLKSLGKKETAGTGMFQPPTLPSTIIWQHFSGTILFLRRWLNLESE
jgi:hypothetical protein